LRITSHSYGVPNDGPYDSYSAEFDTLLHAAPYMTTFVAAGNEGDYGRGYLRTPSTAKNVVTIGAVESILSGYAGPSSVVLGSFSSTGPTQDGRIKPDICGNGVGVYSSVPGGGYDTWDGTSMATPNCSGSAGLLVQHYRATHDNNDMLAATMKALLIHTADEAGLANGPDYSYGWGLMNTASAALLITLDADDPGSIINDDTLVEGETIDVPVNVPGGTPLKVTMVWSDPAGAADANPALVNDLDITVTDSEGTTYYPWSLDPSSPEAPAVQTTSNDLDTVEQVTIAAPTAGTYTIHISHKGDTLTGGSQAFSTIITGTTSADVVDMTLNSPVVGGDTTTGTIVLDGPAPLGGMVVSLTSSDKKVARVPSTVRIRAGASSGTFNITTYVLFAAKEATITATSTNGIFERTLRVTPPGILSFTINPSSILTGASATGTVVLTKVAPANGAIVTIGSNNKAGLTYPYKLVIPSGQTTGTFTINTSGVKTDTLYTFRAAYPGPTQTATLRVAPDPLAPTLTLATYSSKGGKVINGTVRLAASAGLGGVTVNLSVSHPSIAVLNTASITIPPGSQQGTFTITTVKPSTTTSVTVTASVVGGSTDTKVLKIKR